MASKFGQRCLQESDKVSRNTLSFTTPESNEVNLSTLIGLIRYIVIYDEIFLP